MNRIKNSAIFGQYDLTSSIVNQTAGHRYDRPSVSNETFVPLITTTYELKSGYQFTFNLTWTVNFFTTQVKDIIVHSYDSKTDTEHYKYYFSDTIILSENLTLTPSFLYLTNTQCHEWTTVNFIEKRLNDQLVGNIFLSYDHLFTKGLGTGLGINNILNNDVYFFQPYVKTDDYLARPYPGQSREYIPRLNYRREF